MNTFESLGLKPEILQSINDLGFTNGILKVNLNFVRDRVGSDNTLHRVWIQEISPTREEIRIVPLKTNDFSAATQFKSPLTRYKTLPLTEVSCSEE